MSESERPKSPFAGTSDFSARIPLRVLSPDEIERMLAEHRVYLEITKATARISHRQI
jgi:hypothetical protein